MESMSKTVVVWEALLIYNECPKTGSPNMDEFPFVHSMFKDSDVPTTVMVLNHEEL